MQGKALIKKLYQKKYKPIIWVKDSSEPKGKRQLEEEGCDTKELAEHIVSLRSQEFEVFFSDIKETTVEIEGEFYITKGYYS